MPALMSSPGAFTGPPAIVAPGGSHLTTGLPHSGVRSPPTKMDHAAWHTASPLQALSRLRVIAARPAAVPTWRTELPGSGRGGSGQPAVAALFRLSAVHSWVAPRSPARTRREVLSQRPKLTASPSGQADPGAAYYRVIRTRVPSGIPDSRCNAAAGTRTQPLLTAWPNTDRFRPAVQADCPRSAAEGGQRVGVKSERQDQRAVRGAGRRQQREQECPAGRCRRSRSAHGHCPGPQRPAAIVHAELAGADLDPDEVRTAPDLQPRALGAAGKDPPGGAVGTAREQHAVPSRAGLHHRDPGRAAEFGRGQHGDRLLPRRGIQDLGLEGMHH